MGGAFVQAEHAVCPVTFAYLPATRLQAVHAVSAVVEPYLPTEHTRQAVCCGVAAYVPVEQARQALCEARLVYVPTEQVSHREDAGGEYWPAGHVVQLDMPYPGAAVPEGQAVQGFCPLLP